MKFSITFVFLVLQGLGISPGATFAVAADKIKIGFVLNSTDEDRFKRELKSFSDEAGKLGFEAVGVATANNESVQTKKVHELIAGGIKVLVLQPVTAQGAKGLVEFAHSKSVVFVSYDLLPTHAPVDFFVAHNAFQTGEVQALEAVRFVKERSSQKKVYNFVILNGPKGDWAAGEIARGIHSVLDKEKSVKIFMERNHDNWSPSKATATLENALAQSGNKIDAVISGSSAMAQTVVQALAEQGMTGKVFVSGAGAELAAIRSIVNGREQLEVLRDGSALARAAANVGYQLAKGEKPHSTQQVSNGAFQVPTLEIPVYPVTMMNLDERIFQPGIYPKDLVFGPGL